MYLRLVAVVLCVWSALAAAAPDEPKRVLLLHSFRTALPINAAYTSGVVKGLDPAGEYRLELDTETLDLSRVDDDDYVHKLIEIYRLKYRAAPPDLIIPTYTPALRLLLRRGDELFPGVPIVFCGADVGAVEAAHLPAHVTGVASRRDFAGTLEMMSRLQPDLQRVAVVIGASNLDKEWEEDARQALAPYKDKLEFDWLRGLPLPTLRTAVNSLPPRTGILYVVQFSDRDGVPQVPVQVARALAEAANAPVYGLWDTLIGTGIVGGRIVSIERDSVAAGQIARRVLMGEAPSKIPVMAVEHNDAFVDARQLQRWHIDESLLPQGTRVLFREPSMWERHRDAILVAGGVMVVQSALIVALLLNRRSLRLSRTSLRREYENRVQTEGVLRSLRDRLRAAERESTLGAMTAGIAHEVSQPLIAIKNYAQAAKRYVSADSGKGPKIAELLAEVDSEASRAGSIIQKIRQLLATGRVEAVATDLRQVLEEVLAAMKPELETHGCHVDFQPAAVPLVLADPLQVQLVTMNLLRNAAEAMDTGSRDPEKRVSVTAKATAEREVEVCVADCGPGVPSGEIENIFNPLYSTKATGMGIGLATCRTIIEAHGGRIWCSPNPLGGAIFRFTLPVAEGAG